MRRVDYPRLGAVGQERSYGDRPSSSVFDVVRAQDLERVVMPAFDESTYIAQLDLCTHFSLLDDRANL
jgi:hypothetical protein